MSTVSAVFADFADENLYSFLFNSFRKIRPERSRMGGFCGGFFSQALFCRPQAPARSAKTTNSVWHLLPLLVPVLTPPGTRPNNGALSTLCSDSSSTRWN
ncbi:MAG: hypothetical protein ACE5IP_01185, partial [Terriglobia bacterium]